MSKLFSIRTLSSGSLLSLSHIVILLFLIYAAHETIYFTWILLSSGIFHHCMDLTYQPPRINLRGKGSMSSKLAFVHLMWFNFKAITEWKLKDLGKKCTLLPKMVSSLLWSSSAKWKLITQSALPSLINDTFSFIFFYNPIERQCTWAVIWSLRPLISEVLGEEKGVTLRMRL